MITKAHITRRASEQGVPAQTVERDYVLAHIVAAVARLNHDDGLIFKGGTALRICYFDDYRYSADLDFSVEGSSVLDAHGAVARALVEVGGAIERLSLTQGNPPRIAYVGPLGRERTLKLDLADDELVLQSERNALLPLWPDLPVGAAVRVYSLLEITGEKLRCVLQRLQCRDLYDLHLLTEDAAIDIVEAVAIFRLKAQHRGFNPDTFAARYTKRLKQYKERWVTELGEHVPGDLPHFRDVERRVSRQLRRAGLL